MTFRFVRARTASAACLLVLSAACSSTPQQEPVEAAATSPAGGFFVGARPVYAHLVNERGGSWVFTTVTASDASTDSGYLVRLNDLTPAFDTRAAECTPQVYPASHRCSPLHPFRDKDTPRRVQTGLQSTLRPVPICTAPSAGSRSWEKRPARFSIPQLPLSAWMKSWVMLTWSCL